MLYQTSNPHGGDIYAEPVRLDFSTNTNPLGTPPAVISAMKEALRLSSRYPDPYCRDAVSAISRFEGVLQDAILMGNGAAELIYSYCQAEAPRSALIADPTFSEYETALRANRCKIIHHKLTPENDFDLQEDFAEAILTCKPHAVFLCNPNNPTGRLIQPQLLRKILTLCEVIKARLFVDECFLSLTESKPAMNDLITDHPSLFLLKAFTKSHALAGIRVGYCLCSDRYLLQKMSRTVPPWNVSVIAQAAAVAVANETNYLRESAALIKTEREYLTSALSDLEFHVCPSDANFLLFRAYVGLDADLRKEGILIRNCGNYIGLGPGWFRIAVHAHEENEILIQSIKRIVKERP